MVAAKRIWWMEMIEKIVICPEKDSLECFIVQAKGWKCAHSIKHKKDIGCTDCRCLFLYETNLTNCKCEEYNATI